MKILVPPIKCQGIKTKLVQWIATKVPKEYAVWHEPFMGSGVVGFNIQPKHAVFSDTNPHIIQFYNDIKNHVLTHKDTKQYLEEAHHKLLAGSDMYYKEVRKRFNSTPNSLDFLFLNRSCFNGMMRFNSKGEFNVPFCKKSNRFAQSYITKITNQVKNIELLLQVNNYSFICTSFENSLSNVTPNDIIYCDPPYMGRYADYFNKWDEVDEQKLHAVLKNLHAKFILSTWHHNKYRENGYIKTIWNEYTIDTKEHFYHVGASEQNRNSMNEALVTNF